MIGGVVRQMQQQVGPAACVICPAPGETAQDGLVQPGLVKGFEIGAEFRGGLFPSGAHGGANGEVVLCRAGARRFTFQALHPAFHAGDDMQHLIPDRPPRVVDIFEKLLVGYLFDAAPDSIERQGVICEETSNILRRHHTTSVDISPRIVRKSNSASRAIGHCGYPSQPPAPGVPRLAMNRWLNRNRMALCLAQHDVSSRWENPALHAGGSSIMATSLAAL